MLVGWGLVMKTNEANWDRIGRVVVGAGILSLAFVGPATPWGFVGLVPLVTGLIGWCPLYSVFGMSTCPVKVKEDA